jgi:hypothetical protein
VTLIGHNLKPYVSGELRSSGPDVDSGSDVILARSQVDTSGDVSIPFVVPEWSPGITELVFVAHDAGVTSYSYMDFAIVA